MSAMARSSSPSLNDKPSFFFKKLSRTRSRSALSVQATKDASLFCNAIPRCLTMPPTAASSAFGTYFFTFAAQSCDMGLPPHRRELRQGRGHADAHGRLPRHPPLLEVGPEPPGASFGREKRLPRGCRHPQLIRFNEFESIVPKGNRRIASWGRRPLRHA